jgi:ribosomal-protein-alanine N-acetyltransferase
VKQKIVFGPLEEKHIAAVLDLEKRSIQYFWDYSQYLGHIRHGGVVFTAVCADTLYGYITALKCADQWEIYKIAVAQEQRNCGVGRKLLDYFLHYYKILEKGEPVYLETAVSNTARFFYEKQGFAYAGRRKKYYPDGEDCILYVRQH